MVARAKAVRFYSHMLRKDKNNALREAPDFEAVGKKKRGRPKRTWKTQFKEAMERINLIKGDASSRTKWTIKQME